jgi:Pyridoxamine 5'-phosphate oxidase
VHESTPDLQLLQALLDRSLARGGAHLRTVFSGNTAMTATDVVNTLSGVFLLHLATVSASNRPVVAPIDGLFLRGRFLFSAPEQSVRVQHLRRRTQVSATYTEGDQVCIIVHGRAVAVDPSDAEIESFLAEVYGAALLKTFSKPGLTAFIDAGFMVAFDMRRTARQMSGGGP